MRLAFVEARELGHPCLADEHVLLGLLRHGAGQAATLVRAQGLDLATARAELLRVGPTLGPSVDPAGALRILKTWASFDIAWTQRYAVSTYCRVLYTLLHTAQVASKQGALEWALDNLDPKWRPLLTQVTQDRTLGWDPAEPPRPGSLEATDEFAAYAESFAR